MIYIYDILLNFNDDLYEYYEWKKSDNIIHIKKIRLFKVNSNIIDDFFNYDIKISKQFMDIICNKTEIYKRTILDYCAMFTDGFRTIAFMFDKNGKSILRSRLVLEEEEEILDISRKVDVYDLEYDKLKPREKLFLTRSDKYIKDSLTNYFNYLYKNNEISIFNYLYLDYFGNIENDCIDKMYNELSHSLININDKHRKILDVLEKINKKNNIKTSL